MCDTTNQSSPTGMAEEKTEKSFFYRRRKRELSAIFVAVLAYVSYTVFIKSPNSPVVETRNGKLIGSIGKSRIGRDFYEYVGIPYAEPPLGNLRFEVLKRFKNFLK